MDFLKAGKSFQLVPPSELIKAYDSLFYFNRNQRLQKRKFMLLIVAVIMEDTGDDTREIHGAIVDKNTQICHFKICH
jgi:hypothetical protein